MSSLRPAKIIATLFQLLGGDLSSPAEPDGPDGIQYHSKNQLADGTSGGAAYRAKLDGKDYPVSGTPNYDAASIERVSARTFHIQMKKAGAIRPNT